MQYIPAYIYIHIYMSRRFDVSVCRRFVLSAFWFCRSFGLSTFWFVDVLVCRRFGLSTFWPVTIKITLYELLYFLANTVDVSTFRFVDDVLFCRRFGFVEVSVCRRFGLSTFWFVDVLVCRRFGLSTFRFVDVLTSYHHDNLIWDVRFLVNYGNVSLHDMPCFHLNTDAFQELTVLPPINELFIFVWGILHWKRLTYPNNIFHVIIYTRTSPVCYIFC